MQAERVVLCVQDGTDLDFAASLESPAVPPGLGGMLVATDPSVASQPGTGLGPISENRNAEGPLGLHMHTTMALNPEGLPLGLLKIQYATPDGQAGRGRPLEERKTFQRIQGLRDCAAVASQLPDTQLVAVLDLEADVQALFAE